MLPVFQTLNPAAGVDEAAYALAIEANLSGVSIAFSLPEREWVVRATRADTGQPLTYAHPLLLVTLHAAFEHLLPGREDLYPAALPEEAFTQHLAGGSDAQSDESAIVTKVRVSQ